MKQISNLPKLFTIFFCLMPLFCLCQQRFTVKMTSNQYTAHFSAYIAQFNGKKCYVRPQSDPQACIKYCKYVYDYVPSLPYKNAQLYNPNTRLCQPKLFCPKLFGVYWMEETKTCRDVVLGKDLPPVDAPMPVYNKTVDVTVVCKHGRVITFNGKLDCQCDMGYGSLPIPNFGSSNAFLKCNEQLSISAYFPNFMKIYYDKSYDNIYPFGGDEDYWSLLLLYYLRQLKYSIIQFFIPYEVQLIILTIPLQSTFQPSDWIWFSWILIILGIIFVISIYQRCANGLRKNQVST